MKVVLFDADGVLTLPDEMFTLAYSKSRGLDPEDFEYFFRTQWDEIVTGKKDLKESIVENPELWKWDGPVDELLDYWFKSEDMRNEDMLSVIKELKSRGIACYLATDQEKHRGQYMKDVMFKGLFEDFFISAELGIKKTNPGFFKVVLNKLREKHGDLSMKDIIFFDDSQSKIDSAISAGVTGYLYVSVADTKGKLGDEDLLGGYVE